MISDGVKLYPIMANIATKYSKLKFFIVKLFGKKFSINTDGNILEGYYYKGTVYITKDYNGR